MNFIHPRLVLPSPRAPRSRSTGHNRDPVAAAAGRFLEPAAVLRMGKQICAGPPRRAGSSCTGQARRLASVLPALAQGPGAIVLGRAQDIPAPPSPPRIDGSPRPALPPDDGGSSPPSADSPPTAKCASSGPLQAPP